MQIVPMSGRVVVKCADPISKTDGGILLPDTAKERPRRGHLVAASSGKWQYGKFIESPLKVGDEVLFGAHAGVEVDVDRQSLLVMDDTEILAILKK